MEIPAAIFAMYISNSKCPQISSYVDNVMLRCRKMFYSQGVKHILSYRHSQPKCDARIAFTPISYVVQNTISMQGMLKLGGLGACPPRKLHALRLILVAFYARNDRK